MNIAELKSIAVRTRAMREASIALLISCLILGLFLFIPFGTPARTAPDITIATSTPPDSFSNLPILGKAAIVYDLSTGETLYEKNSDTQLPLASLTKLLTVYTALASLAPSTPITVSVDAASREAPHAFRAGDTLALADLARLTLTASLNDGATAIIEAAAAAQNTSTASALASAAAGLNLAQTYALNGSGLDESTVISGGYGSAHDLALLAGALVKKYPEIALATTDSTATAQSLSGTTFTVHNTNPTVEYAPRLLLSKTGYTDLAGGNLALVFDAGIDHPIAVVVLGSTEDARFTDANALVAATLAHFSGIPSL